MSNKKNLEKQAEKLQKELDVLKELINKSEEVDLFSITSYSELCRVFKEDEKITAYEKLKQIERLYNGNWIKNWNNNESKWYPYFQNMRSGWSFGFSFDRYSGSDVSVVYFKDKKTSDYCGKTYIQLFKQIIEE